eukprot:maker-scaffold_6-snap-gene-7.13-mRNA-1 protein AED:0.92 eAED:0.92 QI:0/0/0/0.5/1/1/2/0/1019
MNNYDSKTRELPRLGSSRIIFRDWEASLRAYLGKKHLALFIMYEVAAPMLIKQEKEVNKTELDFVKDLLRNNNYDINRTTSIKTFTKTSNDTPMELMKLSLECNIYVFQQYLFMIYDNEEKYYQAKVEYASNVQSVLHILRSTLSLELIHYIEASSSLFNGFSAIKYHYEKDSEAARVAAKQRLNTIQFRELNNYINVFRKRYAEFVFHGGSETREIREIFLMGLPDTQFQVHKSICNAETLDETIKYFLRIASNLSLRCSQNTTRSPMSRMNIKVTEVSNSNNKTIFRPNRRCLKCGGFGHNIKQCPNAEFVCWKCGDPSHKSRSCKIQVLRINTERILPKEEETLENDNQNDDTIEEHETDINKLDIDNIFQDEEEIQPTHLDSFIMTLNIFINTTSMNSVKCFCRFEHNCFQSLLDSGATKHVVGNKALLKNIEPISNISISGAFSKKIINTVKGTLDFILLNNIVLQLKNVIFFPQLHENTVIISEPALVNDGFSIVKTPTESKITRNGFTFAKLSKTTNKYILHSMLNPKNKLGIYKYEVTPEQLNHCRLGHINNQYLINSGFKPMKKSFCLGCAAGKLREKSKAKVINRKTTTLFQPQHPLQKLHVDTLGLLPFSFQRFKYIVLMVCSKTGYIIPILVHSKENISKKITQRLLILQNNFNFKTTCIFSDHGSEFSALNKYCSKNGILREYSNEYFPAENGRIERQNQTLVFMMKSLLYQTKTPIRFWDFAAIHASKIINFISRKNKISSFQQLTNTPPPISDIKLFGSKGFALSSKTKKLQPSRKIIYLGMDTESKANICYDIERKKIYHFRTVKLDEEGSISHSYNDFHQHTLIPELEYSFTNKSKSKNENKNKNGLVIDDDSPYQYVEEDSFTSNDTPEKEKLPSSFTPFLNSDFINSDTSLPNSNSGTKNPIGDFEISNSNIIQGKRTRKPRILKLEVPPTKLDSDNIIPPRRFRYIEGRIDSKAWLAAYQKELSSLETTGIFEIQCRFENYSISRNFSHQKRHVRSRYC